MKESQARQRKKEREVYRGVDQVIARMDKQQAAEQQRKK